MLGITFHATYKYSLSYFTYFSFQLMSYPMACIIKLFTAVIYEFFYKLECLSLARLLSLIQYLWVRTRAYPRVEHLKGSSLG